MRSDEQGAYFFRDLARPEIARQETCHPHFREFD